MSEAGVAVKRRRGRPRKVRPEEVAVELAEELAEEPDPASGYVCSGHPLARTYSSPDDICAVCGAELITTDEWDAERQMIVKMERAMQQQ